MNFYFLMALTSVLFFGTIRSQSNPGKPVSRHEKKFESSRLTGVKWTWQLPSEVKTSFFQSCFAHWFIESMVRYESGAKTMYRFEVNKGNLRDGDHQPSFIIKDSIDISDNGAMLRY